MDIPRVAALQAGVFLAEQAIREGWSPHKVRWRVRKGQWVYVAGRALAAPAAEWTPLQQATSAYLTWREAVTSHRTAAAIHGLPVAARADGLTEVTTTRRRSSARRLHVHALRLAAGEVQRLSTDAAVTTAARTVVDCLAVLPFHEALDLWAWVSTRKVLDAAGLASAIEDRRCWDGTAQLRRLADVVRDGAVSGGEYRAHELLREAGIDGWRAGVPVYDGMGLIGVADILFEEARVVMEIDGFRAHGSRRVFVSDRRRQNRMSNAGYHVLRFTWDDLVQRPYAVIREVRIALNSRLF
jgi:hypothetical protein